MNTSFCHLLTSFLLFRITILNTPSGEKKEARRTLPILVKPSGPLIYFLFWRKGTLSPQILMEIQ